MTTTIGTFIPVQTQNSPWNNTVGTNGLYHNAGLNLTGWNPSSQHSNQSILLIPTSGYGAGSHFGGNTQGIAGHGSIFGLLPQGGNTTHGHSIPVAGAGFSGNHCLEGLGNSFATELSENNNEYVVSFDVPGIEIGDLDISLSGNTIHINGIRKGSYEASTLAYSEIARGNISRTVAVPFDLSPSKAINTSLENGVLKIRIAKESHSDKKSNSRKVKIG